VSDYHSCLLSNRIRWGYQPHQYGMTRSHDKSWKEIKKDVMLLFFFFLVGLGFELRALCLQSWHSTAWATPPGPFCTG
jgi:hypothetical protein